MADRSAAARKAWENAHYPIETEVLARLPLAVDLTKRNSGGDLRFVVRRGGRSVHWSSVR
jgi:hypothetical protein